MSFERVSVLFVLLTFFIVLVPGCGGSVDARAIEDTVRTFVDATIGGEGAAACLQLSREAQAQLARHEHRKSCRSAVYWINSVDFDESLADSFDFDAIRFGCDGEWARVPAFEFTGVRGAVARAKPLPPIHLEQGDGRWRITDLDWYQELGE